MFIHFKNINDTYGHLVGDQVLNRIGPVLRSNIREVDIAARYGGEEFLICMPGADLETAKSAAECMRKSIERSVIEYNGKQFNITASFGIHYLKSPESESIDELIKHADEKLYLAKSNGRNRVEY